MLLENTRFLGGEETNDERLSRALAELGDLYVNDAFGSAHRAHASTEGVAHYLKPAVAGLLMEKELDYLGGALENPKRPFVAVLGGAKISGKIDVIEQLLPKVDALLIGGAMACTFFKAMGLETGKSLVEADRVEMAKDAARRARASKLILPTTRWSRRRSTAPQSDARRRRDAIPADEAMFDIGPARRKRFARAIASARRPCSGTGRWACSRRRRSTRARARSPTRMAARDEAGRDDDRRRRRLRRRGRGGRPRRRDEPRVHRRRRVARVPRGQSAPGRRRARRHRALMRTTGLRRQLEDESRADRGARIRRGVPRALGAARRSHGDLLSAGARRLDAVVHALGESRRHRVGVQNIWTEDKGAFTGRDLGPDGEGRRRALRARRPLGAPPRVRRDRRADRAQVRGRGAKRAVRRCSASARCSTSARRATTNDVVSASAPRRLERLDAGRPMSSMAIAYEPVWAIGTGKTATPEDASAVHAVIRARAARDRSAARRSDPDSLRRKRQRRNAAALLAAPGVDGLLVGGASLDVRIAGRAICERLTQRAQRVT